MSTSATTQTFAIFELAEAIFLELPVRDLVVHQRTCKQWQAVLAESSKLQEAIFFKGLSAELRCGRWRSWRAPSKDLKLRGVDSR